MKMYKNDDSKCTIMAKPFEIEHNLSESDENELEKCRAKKLHIYHSGLTEVAAPIIKNDNVIGYMTFGQVIGNKDKNETKTKLEKLCREYHMTENIYNKISK